MDGDRRFDGLHDELLQRPLHDRDRLAAVTPVDHELTDHRIIIGQYRVSGMRMAVDTHTRAAGRIVALNFTGARREIIRRVFGVDAALDRVPTQRHLVLLADGKFFAGGDADLLFDNINAGNKLSDPVLHLHTRVHFNKIKLAVFIQKKLHGSGIGIIDRAGGFQGHFAHFAAKLPVHRR